MLPAVPVQGVNPSPVYLALAQIRPVARISCRFSLETVTLVELGYAEDGKAYVRAHGVYAEITPEEVEAFKTEAVSGQTQYEPVVID